MGIIIIYDCVVCNTSKFCYTIIDCKNTYFIEETNILINLCDDYIHTKLNIHFFRFLPEQVDDGHWRPGQ